MSNSVSTRHCSEQIESPVGDKLPHLKLFANEFP